MWFLSLPLPFVLGTRPLGLLQNQGCLLHFFKPSMLVKNKASSRGATTSEILSVSSVFDWIFIVLDNRCFSAAIPTRLVRLDFFDFLKGMLSLYLSSYLPSLHVLSSNFSLDKIFSVFLIKLVFQLLQLKFVVPVHYLQFAIRSLDLQRWNDFCV